MNIIVADTSPLNYLVQIGRVDVLPRLFSIISIPTEVLAELNHPQAPAVVRAWVSSGPSWLNVREVTAPLTLPIDVGEVAAISLAVELQCKDILIDDARGRQIASGLGLNPFGTLRVLERAADAGLLDLAKALSDLQSSNFRIHPNVLDDLRKRNPKLI
jgi:predicted nucleic acid-binding protein